MAADKKVQGAAARIVNLLQCVAEESPEFTLKELAERLGLPQSTVHRLLQVLVKADMIERSEMWSRGIGWHAMVLVVPLVSAGQGRR